MSEENTKTIKETIHRITANEITAKKFVTFLAKEHDCDLSVEQVMAAFEYVRTHRGSKSGKKGQKRPPLAFTIWMKEMADKVTDDEKAEYKERNERGNWYIEWKKDAVNVWKELSQEEKDAYKPETVDEPQDDEVELVAEDVEVEKPKKVAKPTKKPVAEKPKAATEKPKPAAKEVKPKPAPKKVVKPKPKPDYITEEEAKTLFSWVEDEMLREYLRTLSVGMSNTEKDTWKEAAAEGETWEDAFMETQREVWDEMSEEEQVRVVKGNYDEAEEAE